MHLQRADTMNAPTKCAVEDIGGDVNTTSPQPAQCSICLEGF